MDLSKKTVLVTGADGFIGSHLVELLVKKSGNVRALSYYNSFNNLGWLETVPCRHEIDIISGDVRDASFCRTLTKGVDVVFHLAALIGIPYSYVAPASYVETNVQGTLNVCQAALDNNCDRIIHTSTSEVYGTAQYVPIDEKHPLQPQSPYSASKISADAMAMSFFNAFDLRLTIARPFNTYGPRQSARAVIPTIITQLAAGFKRINLGDVTPTRDFNFVSDTCRGFLALAQCDESIGETINIGSNSEISIGDLIILISKMMKCEPHVDTDSKRVRPARSEVRRLWCDNAKMRQMTGFSPEYSIEKGLQVTIDWFSNQENLSKYKPQVYNV